MLQKPASVADGEIADVKATTQRARDEHTSQPTDQPRMSRYTTGILTTSRWTPRDNSSWHVLFTAYPPDIASSVQDSDTEVRELLECQSEERDPNLGKSTISYKTSDDNELRVQCEDDAPPIAPKYFDRNSYFRHAGWTGCASLLEDDVVGASPTAIVVDTSPAAHDASVIIGTEVESVVARKVSTEQPAIKKAKALYHPDENAWLLLLHKKVKAAVEAGRKIRVPGPVPLTLAFNAFFEGRVLQDERGMDLPPREAREEASIKAKIVKAQTGIWKLRDITRKLLESKRYEEVYVPGITAEELRRYKMDGTVSS